MIRLLLTIVIGILLLSFFGISLQSVVNSPVAQENFHYIWGLFIDGWLFVVNAVKQYLIMIQSKLPPLPSFHFGH